MAIQIICDNCEQPLRNEEDSTGAPPDKHVTFRVECEGKILKQMDLHIKCAKKYLRVMADPV